MGVIVREHYVCDGCEKPIEIEQGAFIGRLSLRKTGARGMARHFEVVLHAECASNLIRHAKSIRPPKRQDNGA